MVVNHEIREGASWWKAKVFQGVYWEFTGGVEEHLGCIMSSFGCHAKERGLFAPSHGKAGGNY